MVDAPADSRLMRVSPDFRRYWLTRLVSRIGDGAAEISIILYVAGRSDAGRNVGLVLLAASLPRFFGPLLGTVADRVDRRTLMVWSDLVQAVIYGVIALTLPPIPVLLALIAVGAVCATSFISASRGALPALVPAAQLMRANAWLGTANNVQVVVGPAIGGLLYGWAGVRVALAVDAASFLISAMMLSRLPRLPVGEGARPETGYLADSLSGLRYAMRHPTIRAVVVLLFVGVSFASLDNVALVFLAKGPLHAGPIGYGVLAASFGVGMIAGSLTLLRSAERRNSGSVLVIGWLLCGLGLVGTGVAPLVLVAVLTQVVAGLGNGLTNIAEDTLIQQLVEPEYLGRVAGLISAAAFLGASTAYVIGGLTVESVSPRTLFVVAGAGVVVVTVVVRGAIAPARAAA